MVLSFIALTASIDRDTFFTCSACWLGTGQETLSLSGFTVTEKHLGGPFGESEPMENAFLRGHFGAAGSVEENKQGTWPIVLGTWSF